MKILVVGLGLIGGSIAKSLARNHRVSGMDCDARVLQAALAQGAITSVAQEVSGFDVIYLCLYPQDVVKFTKAHAPLFGDAVLSDVCGIKGAVCPPMTALARQFGFAYVGGHPMAGKEEAGFAASEARLFQGASYIITSRPESPGAEKIKALAHEMGFGQVVYTSPEEHDRIIAFTSQTPHVLACAYVMSPRCKKHQGFSAGSYRDVSRVANINEELWSGLLLSNREMLLDELDELCQNLGKIRQTVADNDRPALKALLRMARETKENFS